MRPVEVSEFDASTIVDRGTVAVRDIAVGINSIAGRVLRTRLLQQGPKPFKQGGDLLRLQYDGTADQQLRWAAGHEGRIVLHPRLDRLCVEVARIQSGVSRWMQERRALVERGRSSQPVRGGVMGGIHSHA